MKVDGKPAYQPPEPSNSFLNTLPVTDPDSFPDIRTRSTIGCFSPIGSTEAESAASGIERAASA